jgi:hypothetical protein
MGRRNISDLQEYNEDLTGRFLKRALHPKPMICKYSVKEPEELYKPPFSEDIPA